MTNEAPRMLGRYELLKRIAKGGMGEIYLARSRGAADFQKSCIIKTILPHLAEEEEFVTKFLDEGRIVVQLVHGNIVPVFDMGDENGEYFIAMEYIPGRDLREVTKRLAVSGDTMPVDLALYVASEVCKGLDYAHRKTSEQGEPLGIVHRDVSPSNVLISREGEVKLIDFGIARAAGRLGKTVSGRIQGKFCYMSPEQASGKKLDGRSDIFSTGVVLYELLTGFRPFEGDSDLESLDLVRQCRFDPPSTLNPEVPEEIDATIAKALEKNPDDRYQTIDRLQIEILQYLYSTGSAPTSNDLEQFLSDLFPDGLEREELRSARDSGSGRSKSPPKEMSLDEALDFEFEKLAESDDDSVDPLQTTAVSSAEIAEGPDSETRTKLQRSGSGLDESAGDGTGEPVVAEDEAAPVPEPTPERASPRNRFVGAFLILTMIGGGLAVFADTAPEQGTVEIVSDPAGAQISVDGAVVPDAVTPHTLELEEGDYTVTLDREGYEPRNLQVTVRGGAARKIAGRATRLVAVDVPAGPRTFTITTVPPDAKLSVDGAELEGNTYIVKPGDVVKIAARHPDCRSRLKQISHAQANDDVEIHLNCPPPPETADAGTVAESSPAEGEDDEPRPHRLTIDSDPTGASITIDGEEQGPAPVKWTGRRSERLTVRATKPGFGPVEKSVRAGRMGRGFTLKLEPRETGCLSLTVMNPHLAEFFVDGKLIGKHMQTKVENLGPGEHKVRVRNTDVGLDHTRKVRVRPGDACTVVSIDGKQID